MENSGLGDAEIQRAVSLAQQVAKEAGAYLMSRRGAAQVAYRKAPLDDVLDADLESERIILQRLRSDFPSFALLSEESGASGGNSPFRWIVDPLDGSVNFQRGGSVFAVSLALLAGTTALIGVTYLPVENELFTAIRGGGATRNGSAISVSQISSLAEAVIHIGELERTGPETVSVEQLGEMTRVAHRARRIRVLGSSAHDLAFVASGRAEALIMHGGEPWDVAAGELMTREAGGTVSRIQYVNGMTLTIFSNERLHPLLLDMLRAH